MFEAADRLASDLGMTRSELYGIALERYIEQEVANDPVTASVNAYIEKHGQEDTAFLSNAGRALADSDQWEW